MGSTSRSHWEFPSTVTDTPLPAQVTRVSRLASPSLAVARPSAPCSRHGSPHRVRDRPPRAWSPRSLARVAAHAGASLPSSGPLEGGRRRSEGAAAAPQGDAAWPSLKVFRLKKVLQVLVGGDIWKGA